MDLLVKQTVITTFLKGLCSNLFLDFPHLDLFLLRKIKKLSLASGWRQLLAFLMDDLSQVLPDISVAFHTVNLFWIPCIASAGTGAQLGSLHQPTATPGFPDGVCGPGTPGLSDLNAVGPYLADSSIRLLYCGICGAALKDCLEAVVSAECLSVQS